MDLITVDISHLSKIPNSLTVLGEHQTINDLADASGTVNYEILTSLGTRFERTFEN